MVRKKLSNIKSRTRKGGVSAETTPEHLDLSLMNIRRVLNRLEEQSRKEMKGIWQLKIRYAVDTMEKSIRKHIESREHGGRMPRFEFLEDRIKVYGEKDAILKIKNIFWMKRLENCLMKHLCGSFFLMRLLVERRHTLSSPGRCLVSMEKT